MNRAVWATAFLLQACTPRPRVEPLDRADTSVSTDSVATSSGAHASHATSFGSGHVELEVGATYLGVTRTMPTLVRRGPSAEDPAVAIRPDGTTFVAYSIRARQIERISVRTASMPGGPLSPPRRWSEGDRGWHPRLTVARSGAVWLTWCGRSRAPPRGDHRRAVYVRRIAPTPSSQIEVSPRRSSPNDRRRHCDPDVWPASNGGLHIVWEAARATSWLSSRVVYRHVSDDGTLGPIEEVSHGPFDRRPRVVETPDGRIWVAWDRWLDRAPTGAPDPDYDLFYSQKAASNRFGPPKTLDPGPGIQAAPRLAITPGGDVLVAYHTSRRHGLIKWWALLKVDAAGEVESLDDVDEGAFLLPTGPQQGSELPAIAVDDAGRIVLASRVSHGTFLHVLDQRGILPALDLTLRGWGGRGLRMDVAFAPDGSLVLARRARHDVVLERFLLSDGNRGPPRFVKRPPAPLRRRRPTYKRRIARLDGRFATALRETRIAFGDVHMHSGVSDGTGVPDEIYARAYVRGLDFAVLTDHDYIVGARMMLSEHDENQWLTDVFDARPDFAALHGYEWTSLPVPRGSGHKNVYFRGHGPSPLIGSRTVAPRTRALQRALADEYAFIAPHHTGWTGTDWAEADPRIQRHLEIVSVHGAFEDPTTQPIPTRSAKPGMFAVDGLARGARFGFLGGSDAHGLLWHHGVGRRMDPWGHGLTGVLVENNVRTSIWDALYARRTFATSGARMWIVTSIGETVLGGLVETKPPIEIRWLGRGTLPLGELVVVRDGTIVHRERVETQQARGRWIDKDVGPGRHSYYVRIDQGEGIEMTDAAWSSPIFVVVPP